MAPLLFRIQRIPWVFHSLSGSLLRAKTLQYAMPPGRIVQLGRHSNNSSTVGICMLACPPSDRSSCVILSQIAGSVASASIPQHLNCCLTPVSLRVAQHPLKVICNPGFEDETIKPEPALHSSRLEGCFANLGRPINHQNERNYPYGKKIPRRSNDCS